MPTKKDCIVVCAREKGSYNMNKMPFKTTNGSEYTTFKQACKIAEEIAIATGRETRVLGPYASFTPASPKITREDYFE